MGLAGRPVAASALTSLPMGKALFYIDQIRLFGVMCADGEATISPSDEGGSIEWPFAIRSIVCPMRLFRPRDMRIPPFKGSVFYSDHARRKARDIASRWIAFGRRVILSSRTRCQIKPVIQCMAIGLAEFLRIARRALLST